MVWVVEHELLGRDDFGGARETSDSTKAGVRASCPVGQVLTTAVSKRAKQALSHCGRCRSSI